jgi:hypothetical protein
MTKIQTIRILVIGIYLKIGASLISVRPVPYSVPEFLNHSKPPNEGQVSCQIITNIIYKDLTRMKLHT